MKKMCEFEPCLEYLDKINDFLGSHLDGDRLGQGVLFDLRVAIEEVFTNIVKHASEVRHADKIAFQLMVADESVQAEISDAGAAFNPLTAVAPELDSRPEDRALGGLGIFLVRQLMDEVDYRRFEGRNILRLRKNVPGSKNTKE